MKNNHSRPTEKTTFRSSRTAWLAVPCGVVLLSLLVLLPLLGGGMGCGDDGGSGGGHKDRTAPDTLGMVPEGGVFKEPVAVTLWGSDAGGKRVFIYYTLDGTEPKKLAGGEYSGFRVLSPAHLEINQSQTLTFIAVDERHNASAPLAADFVIDGAAPTVTADPAAGVYGAAQTVVLSAIDNTAGPLTIYYTLDGSEPLIGDPLTLTGLSPVENLLVEASSEIKYFAVDAAGNIGAVETATYVIDPNIPNTLANPPSRTFQDTITVVLTATDNHTANPTIYYTLDGTDPVIDIGGDDDDDTTPGDDDTAGDDDDNDTKASLDDDASPTPADDDDDDDNDTTPGDDDNDTTPGDDDDDDDDDNDTVPPGGTISAPSPVVLELSATTVLKFRAVDEAGNIEPVRTETYTQDLTPPTTAIAPAAGVYGEPLTVTLTATDDIGDPANTVTIYYSLDGVPPFPGAPNTLAGPSPIADIPINSETTLGFFAMDSAGNLEVPQSAVYAIDTTGPSAVAEPRGGTYAGSQNVALTATDDYATTVTLYYTTDGTLPVPGQGNTVSGASPLAVTVGDGLTLTFFARDELGHDSPVYVETYCIDAAAPVTAIDPAAGLYAAPVYLTLSAADDCDAHPNLYYTLDGSTPAIGGPTTIHGVSPVQHLPIVETTVLQYFAVDQVGNAEAIQAATFTIDTVPPEVAANPSGSPHAAAFPVTLTATDNLAGTLTVYYTTDGSTPTASSPHGVSPLTINVSADTLLRFAARDAAGNWSVVASEQYYIDTTAPVTTASAPGGIYPYEILVNLIATDNRTGQPTIYYTLDGSVPTPGGVTTFSGTSPIDGVWIHNPGTTVLRFRARDEAGNLEATKTENYVIN
ncbi:MAG: hypothetical protein GX444_20520 [Myxococcales bacterium]|nr:hypothetical protein [Myxococcales bacterium]